MSVGKLMNFIGEIILIGVLIVTAPIWFIPWFFNKLMEE